MSTAEISATVHAFKLIQAGKHAKIWFSENGKNPGESEKFAQNRCHPDLIKGMQGLAVHLAVLTEYILPKKSKDADEVSKFVVTGFRIRSSKSGEELVITGFRKIKRGRPSIINGFCKIDPDSDDAYELLPDVLLKLNGEQIDDDAYPTEAELANRKKGLLEEVLLYMSGEKTGEPVQTEMEYPEDNAEKGEEPKSNGKPAETGGGRVTRMVFEPETKKNIAVPPEDDELTPDEVIAKARAAWGNGEKYGVEGRTAGGRGSGGGGRKTRSK